jgi:hypothetical protein
MCVYVCVIYISVYVCKCVRRERIGTGVPLFRFAKSCDDINPLYPFTHHIYKHIHTHNNTGIEIHRPLHCCCVPPERRGPRMGTSFRRPILQPRGGSPLLALLPTTKNHGVQAPLPLLPLLPALSCRLDQAFESHCCVPQGRILPQVQAGTCDVRDACFG